MPNDGYVAAFLWSRTRAAPPPAAAPSGACAMNLRLRLSALLGAVLVVGIGIGMVYLILDVRRAIEDELIASVGLASTLIAVAIGQVEADARDPMMRRIGAQLAQMGDTRHLHIRPLSDGFDAQQPLLQASPPDVPAWFVRLVDPAPLQLVRVIEIGGGQGGIVVRADPTDEIRESWRELWPLGAILIGFGSFAIVAIYFVLGSSLRALDEVAHAFEDIELGTYEVSVAYSGVPDIDAIVARFNHMSDVLARTNRETQALGRRSLAIQEDERRRLAQELHDELGQSISAIRALAVSINDRLASKDDAVALAAQTIDKVSEDIYAQVRRMMADLRPVVLDELGLGSALEAMVDDWNARHAETFCDLTITEDFPTLQEPYAINCYRIVQEALTNIAKHANASLAFVTLNGLPDGRR